MLQQENVESLKISENSETKILWNTENSENKCSKKIEKVDDEVKRSEIICDRRFFAGYF